MKKTALLLFVFFLCTLTAVAQQRDFRLYAVMNGKHLLSTGDSTWIWGYGYYFGTQTSPISLPAPLLTVYLGDTANVHFRNLSGEMHTIHLHGTDVDVRNDGSAHTWPPVSPNDSTIYTWAVNYPGSYFYHCHVMTVQHLQMGMYGMIIAKNYPDTTVLWTGGPGFNKTYSYLVSDMDTMWNNDPLSPGHFHDFVPNYFMLNGYSDWMLFNRPNQVIDANAGDSICLHLGNIGYTTARFTFPAGSNATVYQSDARILPTPFTTDTLRIYPGERYEVILRPTSFITGWITVDYLDAILDDSLATNYIGFNQCLHPTSVVAPHYEPEESALYPNPASASFTVMAKEPQTLEIFSSDGTLVRSQKVQAGNNVVDCTGLAAGFYVVRIGTTSQRLVIAGE